MKPPEKAFYLFKSPQVILSNLELIKGIGNKWSKAYYKYLIEPTYSNAGFLNGAERGIHLAATYMRESKFEKLNRIMTSELVEKIKNRMHELPPDLVQEKLKFEQENIIHSFIHSTMLSSDRLMSLKGLAFYGTVVAFIDDMDRNSTSKKSLRQIIKSPNWLCCNVTFCRQLDPPGIWKITDINFFDKKLKEVNTDSPYIL
uniref:Uncharacterized protein n=1 Tax=Acrobeloides nanus TaxID=290746 RepID=A0A914EP34_9BILA